MMFWRVLISLILFGAITSNVLAISSNGIVKLEEINEATNSVDEVERKPRSLIDTGGYQTVQTGAIPVVSNIQTIQNVPVISNVQTVQNVPVISTVQQQQPFGGGLVGGGGAVGGIGGFGGIGGGFKRYHESYTVRARGFGGGLGFGKFGLGGKLGGLGGIGGIGGAAGGFGGRYKARYTSSYGGGFAGAGLAGGAGGLGGGFLG